MEVKDSSLVPFYQLPLQTYNLTEHLMVIFFLLDPGLSIKLNNNSKGYTEAVQQAAQEELNTK